MTKEIPNPKSDSAALNTGHGRNSKSLRLPSRCLLVSVFVYCCGLSLTFNHQAAGTDSNESVPAPARHFGRVGSSSGRRSESSRCPFLAPLAVLLQLLFPGLLRDQWRQYKIVISVLTTQSTLLAAHWVVVRWFVTVRPRWLADDVLWGAMVAVALVGLVAAGRTAVAVERPAPAQAPHVPRPSNISPSWALLASGLGWAAFLYFTGASPFDQMFVVTVAAAVATMHLGIRRRAAGVPPAAPSRPSRVTTELVLLSGLVLAGRAGAARQRVAGKSRRRKGHCRMADVPRQSCPNGKRVADRPGPAKAGDTVDLRPQGPQGTSPDAFLPDGR